MTTIASHDRASTSGDARFASGRRNALETLNYAFAGFVDMVLAWQARANERRHLAEMDPRILADIGLNRADALHEASKPFWRV